MAENGKSVGAPVAPWVAKAAALEGRVIHDGSVHEDKVRPNGIIVKPNTAGMNLKPNTAGMNLKPNTAGMNLKPNPNGPNVVANPNADKVVGREGQRNYAKPGGHPNVPVINSYPNRHILGGVVSGGAAINVISRAISATKKL